MAPRPLSDAELAALPADTKPRRFTIGRGLALLVNPNGSRYWRFRYRYAGKYKSLSCGVFPAVSLAGAIECRDHFRALLAKGINPSDRNKAERADKVASVPPPAAGAARFLIDDNGALLLQVGTKAIALTQAETEALRSFLAATAALGGSEPPCR